MVEIKIESVSNFVLRSLTTKFPSGKLSVIIGPNGAGKTTLLKVIAGLVKYNGHIFFDDMCVDNLPPYERRISYVPQNNALFPNMSVRDNIAFGLKIRKLDLRKAEEIIEMLGLNSVVDKYPAKLSGGEARKVALARALAVNPNVLLLDEPFTNLDTESRSIIGQEIMMLVKKLKITVLMSTHSVERALGDADYLCILWGGKIMFSGPPNEISMDCYPEDVRYWLGSVVRVDKVVRNKGICYAEVDGLRFHLLNTPSNPVSKVLIPPNRVRICKNGDLEGTVLSFKRHGPYHKVCVKVGEEVLYSITPIRVKEGERVHIRVDKAIALEVKEDV